LETAVILFKVLTSLIQSQTHYVVLGSTTLQQSCSLLLLLLMKASDFLRHGNKPCVPVCSHKPTHSTACKWICSQIRMHRHEHAYTFYITVQTCLVVAAVFSIARKPLCTMLPQVLAQ